MDNSSEAPPQPREAKLIAELLKNSGVEKYEPKVVNMLMEFAHRYLREVLQDCEDYRSHAGKSTIDLEDVAIALERQKSKWTRAPSREVRKLLQLRRICLNFAVAQDMLALAAQRNRMPLPPVPSRQALRCCFQSKSRIFRAGLACCCLRTSSA